jgi:hypothetical protein
MSKTELNRLERDVEKARARFAGDLAKLRAPSTLADFKDDLWSEATETKDALVEKTKQAASDGLQRLVSDLKERAAANPAAALAIGAGVAWRLVHHPPIASLLVGLGAYSLWRTTPDYNGEGFIARATQLAEATRGRARELGTQAGETVKEFYEEATVTAQRASASAQETIRALKDSATDAASQAAASGLRTAGETAERIRSGAGAVKDQTATTLRGMAVAEETRDKMLLGAATVAVAAALGIAYQRRSAESD